MTITRGVATQCAVCSSNKAEIHKRIAMTERRVRQGLSPRQADLDRIAEVKGWMRNCADRGHHDPQAGPAARWK